MPSKEKLLLRTMILTFRYKVIALHSILSTQDQAAAFTLPPPGVRKVKFSSVNLCMIHMKRFHESVMTSYHQRQLLVLSTL